MDVLKAPQCQLCIEITSIFDVSVKYTDPQACNCLKIEATLYFSDPFASLI